MPSHRKIFDLLLSPTLSPAHTCALKGPARTLEPRERGCDWATVPCHLEADLVRLVAQLLSDAGLTEVLHLGTARAAQLQATSGQVHVVPPRSLAGTRGQLHLNPRASGSGCVVGCVSIPM